MEKYTVSPARPADIDAVLDIVRERQQWLAGQGIDQWKGYEDVFPRAYFEKKQAAGELLVARDSAGAACGVIALLDRDPYWKGHERPGALYLHNLAAAPHAKGAGKALLDFCERKARKEGYSVLRLDCKADNAALNGYYQNCGFLPVGTCRAGAYEGTLREKTLGQFTLKTTHI